MKKFLRFCNLPMNLQQIVVVLKQSTLQRQTVIRWQVSQILCRLMRKKVLQTKRQSRERYSTVYFLHLEAYHVYHKWKVRSIQKWTKSNGMNLNRQTLPILQYSTTTCKLCFQSSPNQATMTKRQTQWQSRLDYRQTSQN